MASSCGGAVSCARAGQAHATSRIDASYHQRNPPDICRVTPLRALGKQIITVLLPTSMPPTNHRLAPGDSRHRCMSANSSRGSRFEKVMIYPIPDTRIQNYLHTLTTRYSFLLPPTSRPVGIGRDPRAATYTPGNAPYMFAFRAQSRSDGRPCTILPATSSPTDHAPARRARVPGLRPAGVSRARRAYPPAGRQAERKSSTQEAVLRPTPGNDMRYASAASGGYSARKSRVMVACSSRSRRNSPRMRGAFCRDNPHDRMAVSIAATGASAASSQRENARSTHW